MFKDRQKKRSQLRKSRGNRAVIANMLLEGREERKEAKAVANGASCC